MKVRACTSMTSKTAGDMLLNTALTSSACKLQSCEGIKGGDGQRVADNGFKN